MGYQSVLHIYVKLEKKFHFQIEKYYMKKLSKKTTRSVPKYSFGGSDCGIYVISYGTIIITWNEISNQMKRNEITSNMT